ncbi:MAG: hypothetical protein J6K58_09655 [Lachnospiraceae bacterium]|nr:hypothetical protein [Lachnospiraceae bacterium]
MGRVRKIGSRTLQVAAMIAMALLFVTLFCLFAGGFTFYEDAEFLYSFAGSSELAVLCGLAVLFFLLLYIASGRLFSGCSKRVLKLFYTGMILVMVLVQCYFLFYVRSYYKWDSGFVIGGAASLAETGNVAEEAFYYLSVYPNQNTFVLITAVLVRLGNLLGISVAERPLLFNLLNTVCLDGALLLVIPILKRWKKDLQDWELCRIFMLLVCNPFLYVGVSYYYTITLSLPLTMGFLYLVFSMTEGDQTAKWGVGRIGGTAFLAGILLGGGYELRATAVILGIAVFFTGLWLLWGQEKKTAKRILLCLGIIGLTACLSAGTLSVVQKSYVGIDTEDTAFPTSHWLMMSLTMPGSHNGEDEAYTASFPTKEEKKEAVALRMREKLDAMSAGDYLSLVKTKVRNTFGTGMNGYTTFLADALRTDGLYEAVFGGHRDFVILWHQGYYLFLLLGILLYAGSWIYQCFRYQKVDFGGFFLLLILFGAILFYVLWEASEQYSVPFMMIMSCLAFGGLAEGSKALQGRKAVVQKGAAFCAWTGAAVFVIWAAARFSKITDTPIEQSHPVAVQILANTSYTVDDGEEMVQTLHLTQPFNRMIIQWRNPDLEESTAVYRVQLRETDGEILFEEEIHARGTGYNGAGIYDFEKVIPKKGDYEISLCKIAGEPDHDLEFVIYDMYGYTPYPAGQLYLKTDTEGSGKQIMTASLLFSISEESRESYTSAGKYIIFVSLIFLIFLFMGFWCKLRVVSFTGEER